MMNNVKKLISNTLFTLCITLYVLCMVLVVIAPFALLERCDKRFTIQTTAVEINNLAESRINLHGLNEAERITYDKIERYLDDGRPTLQESINREQAILSIILERKNNSKKN